MIQHFLKLTFRNLARNKVYVLINIVGMGLALATCITAYLNYDFGVSFDRNHEHIDKIYKIHVNKLVNGDEFPYGITPQALGPLLEGKVPSIQKIARYAGTDVVLKKEDKVLTKYFACVDEPYLDMFTYPLKYGSREPLKNKGNVILSEETAEIYFGNINPVGETISISVDDKATQTFMVAGVFEKVPQNTSMQFDGLTSYETYLDFFDVENVDWKRFIAGTFIWVEDKSQLEQISNHLQSYVPLQNAARDDWRVYNFELVPLTELGFVARDIWSNWMWSAPHPAAIVAPPLMALLLLLIACFNFTNTSIAISSKRLQEIGLRKVMGSNRKQLIVQFMSENIVLCFLAMILGLMIAVWLVPAYSALWEGMTLVFDPLKDYGLILFLLALLLITAFLAGAYPSFYISSFEPVSILKGSFKISNSKKFTFSLLTAQYAFTVIALFASVAFARNAKYQQEKDMGFNRETVVYTQVSKAEEAKLLRNALADDSRISSLGMANHHVGRWTYARTLKQRDMEVEANMMAYGENYMETMGLEIIKGRGFDKENEEYDKENSILVNETLVQTFGWDEPIGQRLSINDTTRFTVVGVVKDFFYNGFWDEIGPLGIRKSSGDYLRFVVAKTDVTNVKDVLSQMETEMLTISPNTPFSGDYQEELFKESINVNHNIVIIFSYLGVIAIVLSTIGLFTLVSLTLQRRIKEIGIRKVLGASIVTISNLMNRNFLIMLGTASIFGTFGGIYAIEGLIASIFTYYKEFDVLTILLPILAIFIVSLAVSYSRIYHSATRNPVESLRYE